MSRYDKHSDTQLEPKLQEPSCGTTERVKSSQNTAGLRPVRVTSLPTQCGLGFRAGLEPNQTRLRFRNQTTGVLPGPFANSRNTAMQQNNIWSIELEACTKKILKEVCWSNAARWILHAQTGTRFVHKSIRLNPILFNLQGIQLQCFMISTALNPPYRFWNSLIPFWQTISITKRIMTLSMLMHLLIPWLTTRIVIYPRPWSCLPATHCAMLSWSGKRTKVFIPQFPRQS